jgi:heparosan-N-sulfate-glucuronate 5-epimerase
MEQRPFERNLKSEVERISTLVVRYLHPRSSVAFWHTDIDAVFYPSESFCDYYIDFTSKLAYRGPADNKALPMLDYFGEVGARYNPVAMGQFALGAWSRYRRGGPGSDAGRAKFVDAAAWLAENLEVDSAGRGYWFYRFRADGYGLNGASTVAPWASGLAQSVGISALIRAWVDGSRSDGRDLARVAAKGMLAAVEDGGLCRRFDGNLVIEEGVVERPQAILDGALFAIFGLQDYCLLERSDREANDILREAVDSIARLLPSYDLGTWSRADLYNVDPPMPASWFYHELHVHQLRVMYGLFGLPVFIEYANRWQQDLDSFQRRYAALARKAIFKLRRY